MTLREQKVRSRFITLLQPIAFLAFALPLSAQPNKVPTLDELLQRLETNLNEYDAQVPSFFCDEHAVSQVTPGMPRQNTVTDSVFRLQRGFGPDHRPVLNESREVKSVNGKPANVQDLSGPSTLSGLFEGGMAVVSINQRSCMNYRLEKRNRKDQSAPYVVRFASVITPQNSANCLLQEDGKGRALIDPASMQITRLELTTPHHTIIPGSVWASPMKGEWVLAVDYAPVALDGRNFWMPETITSQSTSGRGTFHQIVWTFHATYRNFHKLEVTSHVVPADATPNR